MRSPTPSPASCSQTMRPAADSLTGRPWSMWRRPTTWSSPPTAAGRSIRTCTQSVEGPERGRPDRQGGRQHRASPASAPDGLPEHGGYGGLLRGASAARGLPARARRAGRSCPRPVAECRFRRRSSCRARVFVKADGVTPDQLRTAWFEPVDDLAACVARGVGRRRPGSLARGCPRRPADHPVRRLGLRTRSGRWPRLDLGGRADSGQDGGPQVSGTASGPDQRSGRRWS